MADPRLTIDPQTVFDNPDTRCVEFGATVDGAVHGFAVQYDVLRALTGETPDDRAVPLFQTQVDAITIAAARALARDIDQPTPVTISENDLA